MNTYSFLDLYVYFLIVAIFVFIQFGIKSNKRQSDLCFLILLLFTVLRYDVGWDYMSYVDIIMNERLSLDNQRYSVLSRLILYVASKFQFYPIAFIVFGTLHLSILRYIINKVSINPAFSWAIYLLFPPFFLQDLSTIRQAVGLEFIFLAFYFINEKKYINAALSYVAATMFHTSTVYGLFLFPLLLFKLPKWVNWTLFISSFVISNLMMNLLQGFATDNYNIARVVAYLDADLRKTSLLNNLYYAINVFFLLFYNRFRRMDERTEIYIQIGNFGIFTFNVFLFEPTMSTRLCTLFIIVWILLIPYAPGLFDSNLIKKRVICGKQKRRVKNGTIDFFVLLPFIALFFLDLMIYVNAYNHRILDRVSFIPYDFWWNHI